VAAVARAHDREQVQVIGYGLGQQSWPENAVLAGAFDSWRDIAALDPATLGRFLAGDGLHLVIDVAGFAAPQQMLALAGLDSAVRIAWLGNPGGLGAPVYDAQVTSYSALAVKGRALRVIAGYPAVRDWSKPVHREPGALALGADTTMAQLDAATVQTWCEVLDGLPEAKLLLRANDMGPGGNIDRLVAWFGRERAARIDILAAKAAEEFYSRIDLALAPRRGVSPRAAAEATACGVPTVAFAGRSLAEPYGPYLADLGLGPMLVAGDDRDYVGIALALAGSDQARAQARAAITKARIGENDARRFALALETQAQSMLLESAS